MKDWTPVARLSLELACRVVDCDDEVGWSVVEVDEPLVSEFWTADEILLLEPGVNVRRKYDPARIKTNAAAATPTWAARRRAELFAVITCLFRMNYCLGAEFKGSGKTGFGTEVDVTLSKVSRSDGPCQTQQDGVHWRRGFCKGSCISIRTSPRLLGLSKWMV